MVQAPCSNKIMFRIQENTKCIWDSEVWLALVLNTFVTFLNHEQLIWKSYIENFSRSSSNRTSHPTVTWKEPPLWVSYIPHSFRSNSVLFYSSAFLPKPDPLRIWHLRVLLTTHLHKKKRTTWWDVQRQHFNCILLDEKKAQCCTILDTSWKLCWKW